MHYLANSKNKQNHGGKLSLLSDTGHCYKKEAVRGGE